MMFSIALYLLFVNAVCGAFINRTSIDLAFNAAVPPSQDPFYQPPPGFENAALGSILRWRPAPNPPGFNLLTENLQAVYQLLYRTSNSSGHPIATVTSIYVPYNADFSKVLSYQNMEDAACVDCAPSYEMQVNVNVDESAKVEFALIQMPLNNGWVVTLPDYEGPNAAFTAGILAGHAVLDGLRAVMHSGNITGINPNARAALFGYSGGSLATGWAAELQHSYAPDLQIAGIAMGGITPNITEISLAVNNHPFVTLVTRGLMGLGNEYPEFNATITEELIPETADTFYVTRRQCPSPSSIAGQDFLSYFKSGNDTLQIPAIKEALDANVMGTSETDYPVTPMFWFHTVMDEVSPIASVDQLYAKWCSKGSQIEYRRDYAEDHVDEAIIGFPDALTWLDDRLEGRPLTQPGCTAQTTLLNSLNLSSLLVYGETFVETLLMLLQLPVGPLL